MKKNQNKKKHSIFSLVLRLAIAILALWIILKDLDFTQLGQTFKRLHVTVLLAAVLVYCLGQVLIGFRWRLVLNALNIRIPLVMAIKLTFLGHFFSQFMPSSVGGDLVRAWYVSKYDERKLQAALSVAVDRIVGLSSTFLLAMGCYLFFMRGQDVLHISRSGAKQPWHVDWITVFPILLSAVFVVAGLFLVLLNLRAVRRMFVKLYGHGIHFFKQFKAVAKTYYHHPGILLAGLVTTIFLQGLVILSFWWIGIDLGISAPVSYYFVFFPLVWAFGSIPVSVAGIGILEGGVVFLFVEFAGCDPETAMALALCQRLSWLLSSIPGVWFHLSGSHRKVEMA